MIPFYLIFAHLVADFLLQPTELIRLKEKSFFGVLLHAAIHGALTSFILYPYWAYAPLWYGIVIMTMAHAIIDQGKISMQLKTDVYVFPFLIDQFLHLITIFGIIKVFHLDHFPLPVKFADSFAFYLNPKLILFLTILIFCTAVYDISRFQIQREHHARKHFRFPWKKLGIRLLVATIVFIGFLLVPLPGLIPG